MSLNNKEYEKRLENLLTETPVVDTHNDFPYLLRLQIKNEINTKGLDFAQGLTSQTDLKKLRKGKVGLQFFSCYLDPPEENLLYQDFNLKNTMVRDTLEQIDVTGRVVDRYSDDLEHVNTTEEAIKAYKEGKIAIALGVEGLHQCDTSLAVLRQYFRLGVRYITLTHNCNNPFATAASSVQNGLVDRGLSDYGELCIKEMNRLGMMVDLSHVSYNTMKDVLKITQAPVIFSHSSAYTMTNHLRNVQDDVLKELKINGGVVQVNFYPPFITLNTNSKATIDDAVNHIFHIAEVAGWEHVGFGSDFDGGECAPIGLEDASKYPDLIYKCMARGATDEQIQGLMGGNLMRVWKQCEIISKQLKNQPIEEKEWSGRRWEFPEPCQELFELFQGAKSINKDTIVWRREYYSKDEI